MMEFTNSLHTTNPNTPDESSDSDDEEKEDIIIPPSGKEDDDLTYNIDVVNDQLLQPIQLTPYNVQTYYSKVGVSILPGIPEEMENEEMNDAIDTINSRRISKISMRLEEINQLSKKESEEEQNAKNIQRPLHLDADTTYKDKSTSGEILNVKALETPNETETEDSEDQHIFYANEVNNTNDLESLDINTLVSNNQVVEPDRIENIEYIHNYGKNKTKFFKEFRTMKSGYCCGCSPYRKFIWKRRYRTVVDFFIDNIFKPLWVSLKDLHFYPTLLSKVMTTITATMCFTLTPYMALEKNSSFQPEDATILLSYVAFSWCLFLVLLPLVINFSKAKFRATFICGLVLAGTCMICKYTIFSQFVAKSIILVLFFMLRTPFCYIRFVHKAVGNGFQLLEMSF